MEGNHVTWSCQRASSDDVRKDHDGPLRDVFNTEPSFLYGAGQQRVPDSVTATVSLLISCLANWLSEQIGGLWGIKTRPEFTLVINWNLIILNVFYFEKLTVRLLQWILGNLCTIISSPFSLTNFYSSWKCDLMMTDATVEIGPVRRHGAAGGRVKEDRELRRKTETFIFSDGETGHDFQTWSVIIININTGK